MKTLQGRFRTKEELDAYFAQEKLPCLICGKAFAGLHSHIHFIHRISADDYRTMFGIPKGRGLAGVQFREKSSARMKSMRQKGIIPYAPSQEHIDRMHQAVRGRKREVLPYHIDAIRQAKKHKPLPDITTCKEFLRRIKTGRAPRDVAEDEDMPSLMAFRQYCMGDPAFNTRVERAMDRLPFLVQIQKKCISDSLQIMIIMLREWENLPWREVDNALLLPAGKSRQVYERMKKLGKITHYRMKAIER